MCNLCKKEKKSSWGIVLGIIGAVVVIAAAAYAIYRWVWPLILEKIGNDFEDDFGDDFFEDDEDFVVDIFDDEVEVVVPETEEVVENEEV